MAEALPRDGLTRWNDLPALVHDVLFRRILGNVRRNVSSSMSASFAERHRIISNARLVCREWAAAGMLYLDKILKLRRRVWRLEVIKWRGQLNIVYR